MAASTPGKQLKTIETTGAETRMMTARTTTTGVETRMMTARTTTTGTTTSGLVEVSRLERGDPGAQTGIAENWSYQLYKTLPGGTDAKKRAE